MAGSYPERLLIHRVSIQRTTGSNYDTRGLDSDVWTNSSTNVPCRLVFLSEVESRDGRNTVVQNWTINLDSFLGFPSVTPQIFLKG